MYVSMKSEADSSTDMDRLISIKGLVIRTTPIIPDMKDGQSVDPSKTRISDLL